MPVPPGAARTEDSLTNTLIEPAPLAVSLKYDPVGRAKTKKTKVAELRIPKHGSVPIIAGRRYRHPGSDGTYWPSTDVSRPHAKTNTSASKLAIPITSAEILSR